MALNDEEEAWLRRASCILALMQAAMTPRMSILRAQVFTTVALKEGQSVSEIASVVKASITTASRHLLDMGRVDRNGNVGYGLVEARKDPLDPRVVVHFLTPKGHELCRGIEEIMCGKA